MIETFCKDCGERYPLGQDHTCAKKRPAKKSASAVKPASRPRMTERSGESRKAHAGQAKKSTGKRKLPTASRVHAEQSSLGQGIESPASVDVKSAVVADPVEVVALPAASAVPVKRPRGRPTGPVPFNKREHDRKKAAERRAKAKMESVK